MLRDVDEAFVAIARQIVQSGWTAAQWAEHESDDWVQSGRYEGGFDATENAFCFSVRETDGLEYWFQLTLEQVQEIAAGRLRVLDLRPAS